MPAGKEGNRRLGIPGESGRDGVVGVQHSAVARLLIAHEVPLRVNIFIHIGVPVEMVGGDIGDDRHVRALLHAGELKA